MRSYTKEQLLHLVINHFKMNTPLKTWLPGQIKEVRKVLSLTLMDLF
jgi:hypothetical protein